MSRFLVLAVVLALAPLPTSAQSYEGTGVVPTGLLLRKLDGVKRVLMIGAHPDDEDTALLTVLARVHGVETAYLSLTRGDGGQNLIGPELWEGLGVIRTGELEAARRLDGGQQFFTRAFDFGYSKTAEEALTLWPREQLLSDAVWVVRRFRPHVIVTVWSGTPRDGHGQHQASGVIAREAFAAAGDPERFPEHFEHGAAPWTPAKLYLTSRRRGGGTDGLAEVVLPAGNQDPLLGRSALQLSGMSRSQHRSQDMGSSQPLGPRDAGAFLLESRVDAPAEELFGGIDTTLVGLTESLDEELASEVRGHLTAYRGDIATARATLGLDPAEVVPVLASAVQHLEAARLASRGVDRELSLVLARKHELTQKALMAAAGIVLDVRADDDLVVPGQAVGVRAQLWNGGPFELSVETVQLLVSGGRELRELGAEGVAEGGLDANSLGTWSYEVTMREGEPPSRLYFLQEERDGWMYRWPEDRPAQWALPRNIPDVWGGFAFRLRHEGEALGGEIRATVPWRYVGVDQARGEFEKPVLVVPAVSVRVTPSALVWPQGRSQPQTVTVTARSETDEELVGHIGLLGASSLQRSGTAGPPEGWTVSPAAQRIELGGTGTERTVSFEVGPSNGVTPGEHVFQGLVSVEGGSNYTAGFSIVDYEHIERSLLFDDAAAHVTVVPVEAREGLRVGYIMGTGDDGPTAIRQMGAEVELLSEAQVRAGDFSAYDALVVGVRAYEAREDVRAANEQILDFARGGGTVVVQYQQFQFSNGGYAPHGLRIGRGRVADETAEMSMLRPEAPLFNTPNRITADDFTGWVQERGLYFASEWGEEYVPLIESNDPGEDPLQGSLLVAPMGEGVYVYAALSFFRQWAGRVPGAYRLFANLISLDPGEWRGFARAR